MKGSLKTKPALTQFLILLAVTLCCFFIIGAIGGLILSMVSGVSLNEMTDLDKLDISKPEVINFLRGLQVVQFISLFLIPTWICTWLFTDYRKK